jgi:hypothetical protein
MTEYYKELDWPAMPSELEIEAIEFAKTAVNIDSVKNHPAKENKFMEMFPGADFSQFAVPASVEQWVRANLPITDAHVVKMQQHINMPFGVPHKDVSRATAFNYLLTEGDAETIWLDDDAVLVDRVQYKKSVWYFHESRVFHQVLGMTHYRLAITVFVPEPQSHEKTVLS